MNFKKSIFISILLSLLLFVTNCGSKKQDRAALTALVVNNILTNSAADKNKSLLQFEVADLGGSFIGKCYDTFQLHGGNITPTGYYNTLPGGGGGALNNNVKKSNVSTSLCSDLGFTTGTNFGTSTQRPNPDDGFTFKMYTCDPNNNPCSKSAITAAGF